MTIVHKQCAIGAIPNIGKTKSQTNSLKIYEYTKNDFMV
jgi:hypothetical protein